MWTTKGGLRKLDSLLSERHKTVEPLVRRTKTDSRCLYVFEVPPHSHREGGRGVGSGTPFVHLLYHRSEYRKPEDRTVHRCLCRVELWSDLTLR